MNKGVKTVGDTILYESLIFCEWSQEPEIIQGKQQDEFSEGSYNLLSNWRSSSFPESLIRHRNCYIGWNFRVDRSGKFVAVLQSQCIEIRSNRDEFSTLTGKVKIEKDPHPQWRLLEWSHDSTMLAFAYSYGQIEVFDVMGSTLFTVNPLDHSVNPRQLTLNPKQVVVGVLFLTERIKSTEEWSCEMLVIHYNGFLQCYKVSPTKGCEECHSFSFSKYYKQGITMVTHHPSQQLLLLSGTADNLSSQARIYDSASASNLGITCWRILNDQPYYKLVTTLSEDKSINMGKSWRRLSYFSLYGNSNQNLVLKLSISPSGGVVAALHNTGDITVWDFPSLRLRKILLLDLQPGCDETNPLLVNANVKKIYCNVQEHRLKQHVIDISWWSDKELALARCSGAVCVSCVSSMISSKNLLGESPEWFEPMPQLSTATDGSLLALECSNQVSKKRRLLSSGSSENSVEQFEDSSDDEDLTFTKKSTKTLKRILYYVTDSERFQPPRKRPRFITRTYRLVCLKSTTPEELLTRKIENEEYGEALSLARMYNLDCDLVYQRQWRKSVASISSIQDYLSKITKRSWVLHECLERVPEDIDAARELIKYGLRGTDIEALISIGKGEDRGKFILCDRHVLCEDDFDVDPNKYIDPFESMKRKTLKEKEAIDELVKQVDFNKLTLDQRQLIHCRRKLLMYSDRLSTYEMILGGTYAAEKHFDHKFYKEFRSKSALRCSIEFARRSNWQAVEAMFTYHGSETLPHRLTILSNFPETTSPFEYQSLLPECVFDHDSTTGVYAWNEAHHRDTDWSEANECRSILNVSLSLDSDEDIETTQFDDGEMTSSLLTKWYVHRACEIEAKSFQVDNALELIKLGQERNIPDLNAIYDDLVTMETLVYECQLDPEVPFDNFRRMSCFDKLLLLMTNSSEDNFIKRVRRWMIPYLLRCENREKNSSSTLMKDYLVHLASSDLSLCLKIFEASRQEVQDPIITDVDTILTCAIECISSYRREEQLSIAYNIFKSLPQSNPNERDRKLIRLHQRVDKLEKYLVVAEILEANKIPTTVRTIVEIHKDRDKVMDLMKNLTRITAKRDGSHDESEWRQLLYDILEMQSKLLECITQDDCYKIFTETLLHSGVKSDILLAGNVIVGSRNKTQPKSISNPIYYKKVKYEDGIDLIIDASREYFDSAANLQDSCMDLARSCLHLIEDKNDSIQVEIDLISSLSLLSDFNVDILPVQVRLCENKLDLMEAAINNKPGAYKNSQQLQKLARLLRIDGDNVRLCEGQVLTLIAGAAIKVNDFDYCHNACLRIIQLSYEPGWVVCQMLGLCEDFDYLKVRCDMLSYAMCYCPSDNIQYLLDKHGLLQVEILYETLNDNMKFGYAPCSSDANEHEMKTNQTSIVRGTKKMLQVSTETTKTVLKTIGSRQFWHDAASWINPLNKFNERDISSSGDSNDANVDLSLHSTAEFFSSTLSQPYHCSQLDTDYCEYSMHQQDNLFLEFKQALLRLALLDETLSEGELSNLNSQLILDVATSLVPEDVTSGLSVLLALSKPIECDGYMQTLVKTDIGLQFVVYYYSLQLFSLLWADKATLPSSLYHSDIQILIERVQHLVNDVDHRSFTSEVRRCVDKFTEYCDRLSDFIQGQTLNRLNFGVDIARFSSDPLYKEETILGLSMTTRNDVYHIGLSLAERYSVSLWNFYSTHLTYLFSEPSITKDELERRITDSSNLLNTLSQDKINFKDKLINDVYPSIDGRDLHRLLYMYTLIQKCCDDKVINNKPSHHVKILKKFITTMSGINYKELCEGSVPVSDVIDPHLRKDNIPAIIKIAPKIPDKEGGFLDSSSVHCCWAVKCFFDGDQVGTKRRNNSDESWFESFNRIKEYYCKLKPDHYLKFINKILFVDRSLNEMSINCRTEILKRAIKYSTQQSSKAGVDIQERWQHVNDNLRWNVTHLGLMQNEPIRSFVKSDDPVLRGYARQFDISRSQEDQLRDLLVMTVVDGQPVSLLDDLLSMCQSIGLAWSRHFICIQAIQYILDKLRTNPDTFIGSLKKTPLMRLQSVLQQHKLLTDESSNSAGDNRVDATSILRGFFNDEKINVDVRLSTLKLVDQFTKLNDDDRLSFLLYVTQSTLADLFPKIEVNKSRVGSFSSRQRLFDDLLNACGSNVDELDTLCRLLERWPEFESNLESSPVDNQWYLVLHKMIGIGDSTDLVINYVRKYHDTCKLTTQVLSTLVEKMRENNLLLPAIKTCLLSDDNRLHKMSVQYANRYLICVDEHRSHGIDDELSDLILLRRLLHQVVSTFLFQPTVDYLLSKQISSVDDYLKVDDVVSELLRSGHVVEAGTLALKKRSAHPSLINFDSALGVVDICFIKE